MDLKKIENNEIYKFNFKNNSIIFKNAIIYNNYIYKDIEPVKSKIVSLHNSKLYMTKKIHQVDLKDVLPKKAQRIEGERGILYTGDIELNNIELMNEIISYGNKIYNLIKSYDKKYILLYISKLKTLSFGLQYENIQFDELLSIIISMFSTLGIPNIDKHQRGSIDISKINNLIIPQLLVIYTINEIYDIITFFSNNQIDEIDKSTFIEKTNLLENIVTLYKDDVQHFDDTSYENQNNFNIYLNEYKYIFPSIINENTAYFDAVSIFPYIDSDTGNNSKIIVADNYISLAWNTLLEKVFLNYKKGISKKCIDCNKPIIVTNNQKRCKACREKKSAQDTTKENKKKIILEILDLSHKKIFNNTEINKKISELQELKSSGKINNIDNHNYLIKDLKKIKENIKLEIIYKNFIEK